MEDIPFGRPPKHESKADLRASASNRPGCRTRNPLDFIRTQKRSRKRRFSAGVPPARVAAPLSVIALHVPHLSVLEARRRATHHDVLRLRDLMLRCFPQPSGELHAPARLVLPAWQATHERRAGTPQTGPKEGLMPSGARTPREGASAAYGSWADRLCSAAIFSFNVLITCTLRVLRGDGKFSVLFVPRSKTRRNGPCCLGLQLRDPDLRDSAVRAFATICVKHLCEHE